MDRWTNLLVEGDGVEGGEAPRRRVRGFVQRGGVGESEVVVELEEDELQEALVELEEREHRSEVDCNGDRRRDRPPRTRPRKFYSIVRI